eukprot:TRINITY_DN80625_c0_g1_i1.p1 TRINITY_DN80625_c0_g1~~TRINITY_DN80625_c0_g1_i1.p1  ORF type:complete len:322 (-),score=36.68 TRINITY_DN80625_c0_g1_i1:103-1068(-)
MDYLCLEFFFQLIALCCRLHSTSILMAMGITRVDIRTYSTSVTIKGHGMVCAKIFGSTWCDDSKNSHPLQEASQMACHSVSQNGFRNACDAFKSAYVVGIAIILCIITNLILQLIGTYLIMQYLQGSPKKQYRETAFILSVIGVLIMTVVITIYYPLVMMPLDSMSLAIGGVPGLAEVSQGVGVAWGFILLIVGNIIQVVAIILHSLGKSSSEVLYAEEREQRKLEMELQQYEAAGRALGGGGGGRGAGMQGAGMQGAGMQGYGMQGHGMQGAPMPASFQSNLPPAGWAGAFPQGPPGPVVYSTGAPQAMPPRQGGMAPHW